MTEEKKENMDNFYIPEEVEAKFNTETNFSLLGFILDCLSVNTDYRNIIVDK